MTIEINKLSSGKVSGWINPIASCIEVINGVLPPADGISQMSAGADFSTRPGTPNSRRLASDGKIRGYFRFAVREGMGCQDYRH